MRIKSEVNTVDILTERTLLNKQADKRRRTWATIEPEDDGVGSRVVLALDKPVEEVSSLSLIHSDVTGILTELDKRIINSRKVLDQMIRISSENCTG